VQLLDTSALSDLSPEVRSGLTAVRERIEGLDNKTMQLVTELAKNEADFARSAEDLAGCHVALESTGQQMKILQVRMHSSLVPLWALAR
jgi:hypothetical protein